MRYNYILLALLMTFAVSCNNVGKSSKDNSSDDTNEAVQARPPATQPFGKEAFDVEDNTVIRWLGMSGFLVNSRGTTFMIDPLLEGFDMPLLIDFPIAVSDVPSLDAVLVTHSDNDHFGRATCSALKLVTKEFHSTLYVDSLMKNDRYNSFGHDIGDSFNIGDVKVKLTSANHMWQNAFPSEDERTWMQRDCTGFWIDTPDGTIWATGDSQLMSEHLEMPSPDVILFDFSDSEWHFTLEGAVKLANTYPNSFLILHHWGTVDAPDADVFNADPSVLDSLIVNPERIVLLAPGQPYVIKKIQK